MLSTSLLAGLGLLSVLVAVPFALPSSKRVERSQVVQASPRKVFEILSSTEGFQSINPYRDEEPNLKIRAFGPASGVGAGFAFEGKDTTGTQTISALETDRSVTMQIDLGAMGHPTQSFRLEPEGNATRVTWATESRFGMNPIGRVFGLFMDGYLGPVYERGLKNLERVAAQ